MDAKRKAIGQRGKTAETVVRRILEKLNSEFANFDYSRIYDARSAGGKFPSRPGDYELYSNGIFGLIEVKEVAHDYRLPEKNFPAAGRAKLRKRQMAGGRILVLVYHSTSGIWRSPTLEYFAAGVPSWDLGALGARDPETEIRSMYGLQKAVKPVGPLNVRFSALDIFMEKQ
jgi:hypothetical protein